MRAETTPTLGSLARARGRGESALSVLRPLAVGGLVAAVVVANVVAGSRVQPRPRLVGDGRIAVLVALAGFGAAVAAILCSRRTSPLQTPAWLLLLASATVLVLLQPFGPGTVIGFVTVGMAASRLSGRTGLGVLAGAIAVFGVAGSRQPLAPVLVTEVGLVACYTVTRLAWRVREGQERAERLLLELDANREAQAQAVVIAERQQLAREMHDVLAHSLSGLVLQLEGARLLAAQTPEQTELGAAVERAHHLAKAGLDEARRAIGMLRDDALPGPERLPALASGFERDTGVPCTMRVTGLARELAPDARLAVYRVAQEALTNIRKHAAAKRVELQLAYDASEVRVAVQDHGAVPSPVVESDGYGLAGMRERADLIGGTLSAAPTETGFRVELRIPA